MALTVKGQPITAQQSQVAAAAIQTGKNLSAPATALEACIYAGMGESSLGADSGAINNVWQANNPSNYGPAPNWSQMAAAFYNGTGDFRSGGAINNANAGHPVWQIANEVESNAVWIGSHGDSYAHQWPGGYGQALAEAQAIVKANGGSVTAGGTAGTGGTGTTGNIVPASPWTVGDAAHPDQDYYSTISQYGMAAQWYVFSNGEQLIAADGYRLIAQRPAAIISRFDPATIYARATWDNTAWLYTATHRRRGHTQRRTSLAKLQSPTGVTLRIVCDIDAFAQGDVVQLAADFKPADGPWLIGDVTRAIYQPYSELTLVKAMTPLNAATGTAQVSQATPETQGPNTKVKWGATSVPGHPELKPHISQIVNTILHQYPGLVITSTVRPEVGSYHQTGEACDISSGDQGLMDRAAAWVANILTPQLSEGIHQDGNGSIGLSVKYGAPVPASFWGASTWAQHMNHIHVARAEAGVNSPP